MTMSGEEDIAFPDYVVTSNETGPGYYIFVLAYTAFSFFLIAPLVTWSKSQAQKRCHEQQVEAIMKPEGGNAGIEGNEGRAEEPQKVQSSPFSVAAQSQAAVSSVSGSHALTQKSAMSVSRTTTRSGRSGGLGLILRELDRVAAAEYPDQDPDFRSRIDRCNKLDPMSGLSKGGTEPASGHSSRLAPSAATTSRLHTTRTHHTHSTAPTPSQKKLSALVLDVGGRRWKNRRPIGRVDVIQHAISHEQRAGSSVISGLTNASNKQHGPPTTLHRKRQGMSDVASSVLDSQTQERMQPSGPFLHPTRNALHHRNQFTRRPSRAGSYSAASERSISVMSSIVDDISPNDAADANDPGRGNLFVQEDGGGLTKHSQAMEAGVPLGCFSGVVEALLELAAPGEEMQRVVQSSLPLAMGAMSEALYRLMTAAFVSNYLGTESMIAYLLVGLFVRLTSEELSGAIIDALSSFVQACLFSNTVDNVRLAGHYVQHAMVLQLLLGVPLLLVWALTMDDVVYWLVRSEPIAEIAKEYARVVVFHYMVQAVSRTCTVVFHICGHEHFESIIDVSTSTLQLATVACVVSLVDNATLTTVGYIQVLIGIAGAIAKIMFPVMRGWMKPFRRGMFLEVALWYSPRALLQLTRAVVPLFLGTLLEYGEWEVLTLFLRHLGPAEVATWALLGALWDVLEALTEGLGEAAAIQVAFLLAAMQPERARKLVHTVLYLGLIQSVLVTSILYMSGQSLAVLLTSDPTLQHLMNNSIALLGLANVTMTFSQISWSLIGAQGRFRLATSVVFCCRWLVTIPIALVTIFAFFLDLNSVSGSLVVGYATASCALSFIVLRSDWDRLARVMQEMNPHHQMEKQIPLDHMDEEGIGENNDDDDHGDPFDNYDDDSDSSDGFGFGFDGEEDRDDEHYETPRSARRGTSSNFSGRSKGSSNRRYRQQ